MKRWHNCSLRSASLFWKSGRLSVFRRQEFGISSGREVTGLRKSCSCKVSLHPLVRAPRRARYDSLYLQFTLATGAPVFFAWLFDEDGPARRLSRKIWSALRDLRPRTTRAASAAKIDMVACSERGGSHDCPQAG